MSKKYYVVWKGAKTGVFDSWSEVKGYIEGRSDAQYMGFPSKDAAQQAFQSTYTKALTQRSLSKNAKGTSPKPVSYASDSSSSNLGISAEIQIYCDGACSPNPGKAGTGIAVYEAKQIASLYYGLYESNGTNNTAELNGMLEAFKLAEPYIAKGKLVEVLSDSKYSIDCITKWAKGWQAKGWTRGKGEEIKNLALVQACFELYQKLKTKLKITHVKGHANIEGNELSDRMAVFARMHQEARFVKYEQSINIAEILRMPSG